MAQDNLSVSNLLEFSKINDESRNEARVKFQKKYTGNDFHVAGPFIAGDDETEIEESGSKNY